MVYVKGEEVATQAEGINWQGLKAMGIIVVIACGVTYGGTVWSYSQQPKSVPVAMLSAKCQAPLTALSDTKNLKTFLVIHKSIYETNKDCVSPPLIVEAKKK